MAKEIERNLYFILRDEFRAGISSARLADKDIDFNDLLKKDC